MSSQIYSGGHAVFQFANHPRFYACIGCGEAGDAQWTVPCIEREQEMSATWNETRQYSSSGGIRQYLGCSNGCARPLDRLLDAEATYALGGLSAAIEVVEERGFKWCYKNGRSARNWLAT